MRSLLIVHHLLLGDTIMLAPLLKKARSRYPGAEIVMTCPEPYLPLFAGRPYGVTVLPLDPASVGSHLRLHTSGGFDLALLPGDNRWSWLASALGARWTVGFAPDRFGYKEWPVDETRAMPQTPMAWGDMAAMLVDGAPPSPYTPGEWPAPAFAPYERPPGPYWVFHLGARNPLRLWPPERWRALLEWAESRGHRVVLTCGRGEEPLCREVDPTGQRSELAGRLDLTQLWNLIGDAGLVVCPDTGIAHLARLTGTPTVAIYGQGSPVSTGPGAFWAFAPFRALWDREVPCRDQDDFFGRRLVWLKQCARGPNACSDPICIKRVTIDQVIAAVEDVTRTASPSGSRSTA